MNIITERINVASNLKCMIEYLIRAKIQLKLVKYCSFAVMNINVYPVTHITIME